jgi:hypothetical protein
MTSTRALHDIAGLHGQNPHQLELTGVGHV